LNVDPSKLSFSQRLEQIKNEVERKMIRYKDLSVGDVFLAVKVEGTEQLGKNYYEIINMIANHFGHYFIEAPEK